MAAAASTLVRTAQFVGLSTSFAAAGVFFGSSNIFVPTLYRQTAAVSTDIFDEFYHRGAATAVPLVVLSALGSGTVAYLLPAQRLIWAGAALASGSALLWTLAFMLSTNNTLLRVARMTGEKQEAEAKRVDVEGLLRKWRWMNFVRSGMCFVGGSMAAAAVVFAL